MNIMKKSFKQAIKKYAEELDWTISNLDEEAATLEFETDDAEYTLYLELHDNTLVFSVPASPVFKDEDDLPGDVSTELLMRNAEIETGFWAIEELEEGWGYIIYYDQKLTNKNFDLDLDTNTFKEIVEALVEECDDFNSQWDEEE